MSVDTILHNAKIATNGAPSFVEAIAIESGKVVATGRDEEILRLRDPATMVIDGRGRTVIPGLNDSHMHPIRGGGKVVYATAEFSKLAPPALPVSPGWSPIKHYGGYAKSSDQALGAAQAAVCTHLPNQAQGKKSWHLPVLGDLGLWELGCDCFAF